MKRQIVDGFSDGQNCNGNFMRPGSIYVDNRNDQIRYVDKDGTEQWCVPVSAYFASEEIKRGEAVSISSRGDLANNPNTRSLSDDIYPYVHKTNPDEDESCLGLALNYATKGQLVHVQNTGTIRIHAIDGEYSDGISWSDKEVIFDGKETDINGDNKDNPAIWGFKNVSGQKVYVKKPQYDENNQVIPETCGKLTFDFKDSVYTAKHTIQIGYFTDGPLESTYNKAENAPDGDIENPEDLDVWIELDVTGDTRGPLENTQFLVELAEPFTVTEEDSIKCFSIGQSYGAVPKISFNITTGAIEKIRDNLNDASQNKKIFFSAKRSFLEKNEETSTSISTSYSIVPFFRYETGGTQEETTTNVINSILNEVNNPEDKSFIGVISYNGFDGLEASLVSVSDVAIDQQAPDTDLFVISEAIKDSFNGLLSDKEKEKVEWVIVNKDGLTTPVETGSNKFNVQFELVNKTAGGTDIENNNYIGSFEYYFSEGLNASSDIEIIEQNPGSESNAGKAIISDIRTLERSNVFGVYCGGDYGREHAKGEVIALMKMGTIVLPGKQTLKELNFTNNPLNDEDTFKNGGVYYLGINGRVYRNLTNLYYDKVVQIAQQIGENEKGTRIVVDVSDAMTSTADNGGYPIGFIKQAAVIDLNDGTQTFGAEYGYLVCDGVTKYSTATYKDLYEFLLSVYPQSFLVDENNPSEFTIPKITLFIPDGTQTGGVKEVYAQIKAVKDGIFREIPRLPFVRKKLRVNDTGKIDDIDITSLVRYGTLEETAFPTIDNINIQLYIKDDEGNWRELQKGFNLYNNTILYGYDWLVDSTKDNFTLKMDIADGIGISKVTTTTPPIPLVGSDCVVTITMKNLWAREYRDIKETIEDKIIDDIRWLIEENQSSGTTVVPSVKATYNFVKDKVETKELKVFNEDGTETFTSTNKNSVVTGNFLINDVFKVELGDDGYKAYYKANNGAFIELLTRESIDSHISESIEDTDKVIHGIKNTGADGNIDAAKVSGYSIGTYSGAVTQNNTDSSYIPYVNSTSKEMKVGAGIEYGIKRVSDTDSSKGYYTVKNNNIINTSPDGNSITTSLELFKNNNQVSTGIDKYIIGISPTAEYKYLFELNGQLVGFYVSNNGVKDLASIKVKSVNIGDNYSISDNGKLKINNVEAHSIKSGTVESNTIYSPSINIGTPLNSKSLDTYIQENSAIAKSSIAYKNIVSEYVINEAYKVDELYSNIKDKDGNPLVTITKDEINDTLFENLGSALQILHELPLSKFKYKEEINAKDYLGILVERVNVAKQKFEDKNVTISHQTVFGMGDYPEEKPYEKYNSYKTYTYTSEEKEKIAEALNIITDNKEFSQNIISSIGLLLKAAHEAQDRLVNLEASVFGYDCKPGTKQNLEKIVEEDGQKISGVAEDLRDQIIQLPLLLGLNRIVRALCLEVFNDADYSYVEGEEVGPGTTVKSRIDFIEDELNKLKKQYIEFLNFFQNEHYALFKKVLLTECEVDEADPTSITITGDNPNWNNLPSKEQYTTPTENTGENIGTYNEATNGTCKPVEADVNTVNELQIDNEYIVLGDDGHPAYTDKKYLSLESKVERLNMKLSQLTKSLYGVDDPLYTSPNRLEVIRRNIASLYKEVYFNDLEYGEILNKIEPVITDDTGAPIDGVDIRKPFEKLDTDGSFIDSIIDQFYSFTVKQNLAENSQNIDTTQYTYKEFKDNNFNKAFSSSKVAITDGQFIVSNEGLVSSKEDDSLSYSNAITTLDLLRERIGEDYTWYKLLYKAKDYHNIIDALTNDEGETGDQPVFSSSFKIIENKDIQINNINTSGIESDPLYSIIDNYKKEIYDFNTFFDNGVWDNISLSGLGVFDEYSSGTVLSSYLSRKERSIEPRLTSLEAISDTLSSKEVIISKNLIPLFNNDGSGSDINYFDDSIKYSVYHFDIFNTSLVGSQYINLEPSIYNKSIDKEKEITLVWADGTIPSNESSVIQDYSPLKDGGKSITGKFYIEIPKPLFMDEVNDDFTSYTNYYFKLSYSSLNNDLKKSIYSIFGQDGSTISRVLLILEPEKNTSGYGYSYTLKAVSINRDESEIESVEILKDINSNDWYYIGIVTEKNKITFLVKSKSVYTDKFVFCNAVINLDDTFFKNVIGQTSELAYKQYILCSDYGTTTTSSYEISIDELVLSDGRVLQIEPIIRIGIEDDLYLKYYAFHKVYDSNTKFITYNDFNSVINDPLKFPEYFSYSDKYREPFEYSYFSYTGEICDNINRSLILNLNRQFPLEIQKNVLDDIQLRKLLSSNTFRTGSVFYTADLNEGSSSASEAEDIYRNYISSFGSDTVKSVIVYYNNSFNNAFYNSSSYNALYKKLVIIYYKSESSITGESIKNSVPSKDYYTLTIRILQNTQNNISNIDRPDIEGSTLSEGQKVLFNGLLDNGVYRASDLGLNEYLNALNHNDMLYNIVNVLVSNMGELNNLREQVDANTESLKNLNDGLGGIDNIGQAFTFTDDKTISNKAFESETQTVTQLKSKNDGAILISNSSKEELATKKLSVGVTIHDQSLSGLNLDNYRSIYHFDTPYTNNGLLSPDLGNTNCFVREDNPDATTIVLESKDSPLNYEGSKYYTGNAVYATQFPQSASNKGAISFYYKIYEDSINQENLQLFRLDGATTRYYLYLNYDGVLNNDITLVQKNIDKTGGTETEVNKYVFNTTIKADEWNFFGFTINTNSFTCFHYSGLNNTSKVPKFVGASIDAADIFGANKWALIGAFTRVSETEDDFESGQKFKFSIKELSLFQDYLNLDNFNKLYSSKQQYGFIDSSSNAFILDVADTSNFQSNIFQTDQFKADTCDSKDFRDNLATGLFTETATPFDNIFYKNLINTIYPVGCTYTQYPVGKDFVDSQKPANLWPGTQWELVFNGDGVFFRTEGGNSDEDRSTITGIQEDSIKEHSHRYNSAHTHTLKVIDYNNANNEYTSILSGNNSEISFSLNTESSEGEHSHGNNGYTSNDGSHSHDQVVAYKTGGGISNGQVLDTSNAKGNYEGTGLSRYPIISKSGSSHQHSIPKTGSTHKHSIYTKITLYRSGSENDKTNDYGESTTETRPKNRLIKIWRRTL